LNDNAYHPPWLLGNGHIQTIFPVLFRAISDITYTRQRITTPDDDFLDLDWSCIQSRRLAVISHGLEGCSDRAYVKGMARAVNCGGWDALAWNYRGCSGEPNKRLRFYHNGATDDLSRVIDHAAAVGRYDEIALIGFSLGGNLTLVHLGRDRLNPKVSKAVAFSVPCDLETSAALLARPANRIYMKRFLRLLHEKIKAKKALMPDCIDDKGYEHIKDFKGFDDRYTAPIHGFRNAEDYWRQCGSRQFIPEIRIPTLIVNAANDPFLTRECFPVSEAGHNSHVTLNIPKAGGHVGFVSFNRDRMYWSEYQAVSFLNGHI
jgi:predicted alpha/beta-fold hydrolase